MQKVQLTTTDGSHWPYILQKTAQVSKVGVYAYCFMLVGRNQVWALQSRVLFSSLLVLTCAVFLISGHRSGIMLLLIQFVFLLQATNRLRLSHLVWGALVFLVVNVLVLLVRDTPENTSFLLVNVFRRYFFEIEKMSAVAMMVQQSGGVLEPLSALCTQVSTGVSFEGSFHHYLGNVVLQSRSAVPPTLLGEIWAFWGSAFFLPVAVALGYTLRWLERRANTSEKPILVVILTTVASTAAFFLLNTDTMSFLKRSVFEMALIGFAALGSLTYSALFRRKL